MKLKKLIFLLLFLSISINGATQISNLEQVTFVKGTSEFTYQFLEPTLQNRKDIYFFFKFSDYYNINLKVIDEDKNEKEIAINSYSNYMYYNIIYLKSQNYTFIITSDNYKSSQTMTFIDSSRDININIDELFFKLDFKT